MGSARGRADLPGRAAGGLAVVTCMDSRIAPREMLGLASPAGVVPDVEVPAEPDRRSHCDDQLAWRRMYSSSASRLTSASLRPWADAISSSAARAARDTRTVMTGVRSRSPLTEGRPGWRRCTRSTISSTLASVRRLPSGSLMSSVSRSTSGSLRVVGWRDVVWSSGSASASRGSRGASPAVRWR